MDSEQPLSPASDASSGAGTQTLARGLGILMSVAGGAVDLKEIAKELGTTRATTHRLAAFLKANGWLRQIPGRGYSLGPKLIELGSIAVEQVPLSQIARPYMLELSDLTSNTIHLGTAEGHEVLYLEKIPGKTGQEMRSRVGSRMPLAITGVGKALMLDMSEAEWQGHYERAVAFARKASMLPPGLLDWEAYKERMWGYVRAGHAFDVEENEVGIRCVSAPIRDSRGRIAAAISVASTLPFMPMERLAALAEPVRLCGQRISRELGWAPRQD